MRNPLGWQQVQAQCTRAGWPDTDTATKVSTNCQRRLVCVCVYLCVRSEIVFMCAKVEQFLNKAIRKINQTHMENYSVIAAVSVSVLVSVAWRINHQQLAAAAAAVAPTAAAAANEKRHKSISDFHSRETR